MVLCPFCTLTDHSQAFGSLGLIGPSVPLIPTIPSSLKLVELRCGEPVDVTSNRKLNGHTFRVSGVCYWASVVGLVATAHLARHTVDTVLRYAKRSRSPIAPDLPLRSGLDAGPLTSLEVWENELLAIISLLPRQF